MDRHKGGDGSVGQAVNVYENRAALYPSLLRYSVASLPALLLEEGDLAPNST